MAAYNYSDSECIYHADECETLGGISGLMELDAAGKPILQGPSPAVNLWAVGDVEQRLLVGDGAALVASNSTAFSLRDEMNSEDFSWLLQANSLYLGQALTSFVFVYLTIGLNTIDSYVLFLNFLVPSFLSLFMLAMALVFLPHIKKTNEDIQRKRGMVSARRRAGGRVLTRPPTCVPARTPAHAGAPERPAIRPRP